MVSYTTNTIIASTSATNYADTAVTNGTTYYYVVSAIDSQGETDNSGQVSAIPSILAQPTNVVATAGNAQVALSWAAVVGATSYNVKRATVSGGVYTTNASPATTSYTDTNVVNDTPYYYVVSAMNASSQGPNSRQAFAVPQSGQFTPLIEDSFTTNSVTVTGQTTRIYHWRPGLPTGYRKLRLRKFRKRWSGKLGRADWGSGQSCQCRHLH